MSRIYQTNHKIINCLKFCFFIGLPLMVSFFLVPLAPYRMIALVLLLSALYLNHYYPDKIAIESGLVKIKRFLVNDWAEYSLELLTITQEKNHLQIYIDGSKKCRISKDMLSARLYAQLGDFIIEK